MEIGSGFFTLNLSDPWLYVAFGSIGLGVYTYFFLLPKWDKKSNDEVVN